MGSEGRSTSTKDSYSQQRSLTICSRGICMFRG
ncbi:hypothetical protein Golob_020245 [Gossypium lobatum]|uniref:Uncharacterized protein n=1 Tax=Gossypium lobatum TaxID=34289 RepID=A0A7J8L9R6_9ROSI|nr:hypothetical protein [Gossypium lobatum]